MMKLRVPIPAKRSKPMLELAQKVLVKHEADGIETKLVTLDWLRAKSVIEKAIALQVEAETLRSESQQRIQDRNILMEEVSEVVRNARDILTGTFKKDMKKLGKWGYNVVEAKARKTTPPPPEDVKEKSTS